jgi:hypothetical protein
LASVVSTTTASAATSSGAGIAIFKTMTTSKFSFGVASAVLVAGAVFAVKERKTETRLLEQNALLHQQNLQAIEEAGRISNQLAEVTGLTIVSDEQTRELMRLRGEVGLLRRQLADRSNDAHGKEAQSGSQQAQGSPKVEFFFVSGGGVAIQVAEFFNLGRQSQVLFGIAEASRMGP